MTGAPYPFPSRAHAAAVAAFASAAALAPFTLALAAVPLALFVAACGAAPFFPSWCFFLPTVLRGARSHPAVALTFDDGPDPRALAPLLALLAREQVPATFFVVGRRVAAHPQLVPAILAAGHEVGNHSSAHDPLLMMRSVRRLRDDVAACQEELARAGAVPLAFRPPVGITNPRLLGVLRSLGLACVMFSCRPLDFANRRVSNLCERVLRRVGPGDIVLLHDVLPDELPIAVWLDEVAGILAGLRARGLRVVPLSVLIGRPVMRRLAAAAPSDAEAAPALATRPAAVPPPGGRWERALGTVSTVARTLFVAGYPLLVLAGLTRFGARGAALMLLLVLAAGRLHRLRGGLSLARGTAGLSAVVAALLVAAAFLNDGRYMLAYPTLVNVALLGQFAWSLRGERSMVERFARLQVQDLTSEEVRYCRAVTTVWCGFFVLNGTAAAALAAAAPRTWWATYTGFLSYLLVGGLFASEYLVRKARFGRYGPGPLDRVLAHLFGNARPS